MKLNIPNSCIDKDTIVEKDIVHSEEYKDYLRDVNKRIEERRIKQFETVRQARNYIHNYDKLPRA